MTSGSSLSVPISLNFAVPLGTLMDNIDLVMIIGFAVDLRDDAASMVSALEKKKTGDEDKKNDKKEQKFFKISCVNSVVSAV